MPHMGPALAAPVCLGTTDKAAETERPVSPALSVRQARIVMPVPVAGWGVARVSARTTDGSHPTMI